MRQFQDDKKIQHEICGTIWYLVKKGARIRGTKPLVERAARRNLSDYATRIVDVRNHLDLCR